MARKIYKKRMFAVAALSIKEMLCVPQKEMLRGAKEIFKRTPQCLVEEESLQANRIKRVKIRGISQELPYRVIETEEMNSIRDDSSHEVRKQIEVALEQNKLLGGEVTDEMLEFLNPLEDDDAFVDLAAFTLCRHTLRKQAMLEVQHLTKRASMLLTDLHRENDRLATIKQLMKQSEDEGSEEN